MHNDNRILNCRTFKNKRPDLVIELPDRELHPYVLDGRARCDADQHPAAQHKRRITTIEFNGWTTSFEPAVPEPSDTRHYGWVLYKEVGIWQCQFEVIFRMVDWHPSRKHETDRKPDVLAISFDGCQSFVNNAKCLLQREYEDSTAAV